MALGCQLRRGGDQRQVIAQLLQCGFHRRNLGQIGSGGVRQQELQFIRRQIGIDRIQRELVTYARGCVSGHCSRQVQAMINEILHAIEPALTSGSLGGGGFRGTAVIPQRGIGNRLHRIPCGLQRGQLTTECQHQAGCTRYGTVD